MGQNGIPPSHSVQQGVGFPTRTANNQLFDVADLVCVADVCLAIT
jgi:hypothetical protein